MTFVHGRRSHISVDAVDISAYADQVQNARTQETAEVTAFGDDDKVFISGLMDGQINLSGHWDSTADAALHGCFDGAEVSVIYGPAGNGTGAVRYTANFIITNYTQTNPVGDKVSWSAALQRSGAVTRDTF